MQPHTGFCTIEEALAELRAGRMVVLVDDENRENEGDLVVAAEKVTPEAINFMIRNACGLVCLAMSPEICDRLRLDPLPSHNVDPGATPFTPYIDARHGISTGTSAFDRARTIQALTSHRRRREKLIDRELTLKLPTRFGTFDLFVYQSVVDPEPHLALCMGGVGVEVGGVIPEQAEPVLVRIHSQCLTGDLLG